MKYSKMFRQQSMVARPIFNSAAQGLARALSFAMLLVAMMAYVTSAQAQILNYVSFIPDRLEFGEVSPGMSSTMNVRIQWYNYYGDGLIVTPPTGDYSTTCTSSLGMEGPQYCTVTFTPSVAGVISSQLYASVPFLIETLSLSGGRPQTHTIGTSVFGNGNITSDIAGIASGIDCGATCSDSYAAGTVVTLTASPSTLGTQVASWGGDCAAETSTTCTVTMDAAKTVAATFQEVTACPVPSGTDLNSDGVVDSLDLGILMKAWSP